MDSLEKETLLGKYNLLITNHWGIGYPRRIFHSGTGYLTEKKRIEMLHVKERGVNWPDDCS